MPSDGHGGSSPPSDTHHTHMWGLRLNPGLHILLSGVVRELQAELCGRSRPTVLRSDLAGDPLTRTFPAIGGPRAEILALGRPASVVRRSHVFRWRGGHGSTGGGAFRPDDALLVPPPCRQRSSGAVSRIIAAVAGLESMGSITRSRSITGQPAKKRRSRRPAAEGFAVAVFGSFPNPSSAGRPRCRNRPESCTWPSEGAGIRAARRW